MQTFFFADEAYKVIFQLSCQPQYVHVHVYVNTCAQSIVFHMIDSFLSLTRTASKPSLQLNTGNLVLS